MIQLQELVEKVAGPIDSEHRRGMRILQSVRRHFLMEMEWDADCWEILNGAIDACIIGDALDYKRRYARGR